MTSSPGNVTLALLQTRCSQARSANLEKALSWIRQVAVAGANVVCLPELFAGLNPCQREDHRQFDQAKPIPGPTTDALAEAVREHGVVVIGSVLERLAAGL